MNNMHYTDPCVDQMHQKHEKPISLFHWNISEHSELLNIHDSPTIVGHTEKKGRKKSP